MTLEADNAALEAWWQLQLDNRDNILDANSITAIWWSYGIGSEGVVQDEVELDQTIKIILSTPYGADIHRPDFASNVWNYIDYPIPQATPNVIRESVVAIDKWEPRVDLVSVNVRPYDPGIAGLTVVAEWQIESFVSTTAIALGVV